MVSNAFKSAVWVAFSLVWIGSGFADDQSLDRSQLARRGKAATALVKVGGGRSRPGEQGFGSAFCVHGSGLFVTNEHVVHPRSQFPGGQEPTGGPITLVVNPGQDNEKSFAARVVRADKQLDLALLRVDGLENFPALSLGDDEKLEELAEVVAFGFPYGTGITGQRGPTDGQLPPADGREYPSVSVNAGSITALRRKEGKLDRIQLDATINPGNSGGPVLDKSGKVVGVVVSIAVAQGIGRTGISSAIPGNHVARFVSQPDVEFNPPEINPANVYKPVLFQAKVVPILPSATPLSVDLIVKPNHGPEQTCRLEADGSRFKATITPLQKPAGTLRLRLLAQFENGLINVTAADGAIKVGDRAVPLGEIRSIRLKPEPRVVLYGGKEIEGPVSDLDAVPVRLGDQALSVNLTNAAEISIAPAIEADELLCTLVVRQGDREVLRQTGNVIIEGVVPAPDVSTPASGIRRPALQGNPAVRKLAGPADDVAVGGGGRYLVLRLSDQRKLAVFDVNTAEVAGYIPIPELEGRFAAGIDRVIVVLPGAGTIERWDLKSLRRDVVAPLPFHEPVKAVAMGCASKGPLLVFRGPNQEPGNCTFALVDVESMKLIQANVPVAPHMQHLMFANNLIHIRASANGKLFGMWCTSHFPSGVGVIEVSEGNVQSYYAHRGVGHVVPSPDGKLLFTRSGRCEPRVTVFDTQNPGGDPVLPACNGDFYLTLPPYVGPAGRRTQPRADADQSGESAAAVTVRSLATDRTIATFPDMSFSWNGEDSIKNDLTLDKRIFLIPEARLVVTLPATNDRLNLYPFGNPPPTVRRAGTDAPGRSAPTTFWPFATGKGEGCYVKLGEEWLEVSEGKVQFKFKETGRVSDYVEIYDEGRKMRIRLYPDKGMFNLAGGAWQEMVTRPTNAASRPSARTEGAAPNRPAGTAPAGTEMKRDQARGAGEAAPTARDKIAALEARLRANPRAVDLGIHNDLRHLYRELDEKKSLEHCDVIFQHSVMDAYTLDAIGARHNGTPQSRKDAVKALLGWPEKYPEFPHVSAACWIKAAELLTDDRPRGKELLKRVDALKGVDLDKYKELATSRLRDADKP